MEKCRAVSLLAHPHVELARGGGGRWVSPRSMLEETGSHSAEACTGRAKDGFIEKCVARARIRPINGSPPMLTSPLHPSSLLTSYGIGMALYFKFLRLFATFFAFASLLSLISVCYYWKTRYRITIMKRK